MSSIEELSCLGTFLSRASGCFEVVQNSASFPLGSRASLLAPFTPEKEGDGSASKRQRTDYANKTIYIIATQMSVTDKRT